MNFVASFQQGKKTFMMLEFFVVNKSVASADI
jgi:hypothetical protein